MRTEYKRDMNHNYLVFYGEEELDTSSYQIRMLVGNVIPSLLKCRIQGRDGNFVIYYDVTSRQSLTAFYEDKKLKQEDLKLIFGEFVRVMEDAAEYLMNPGQLVLAPEYMFLEVEKKEIYFCLMPGYQKDMKEQFQTLTEYILPKIDHEDEAAVMIGYGVYRRAMEDSFHLEHIKEELYRAREKEEMVEDRGENPDAADELWKASPERSSAQKETDLSAEENEFFTRRENYRKERHEKKQKHVLILKNILGFGAASVVLAALVTAKMLGYLPDVSVEVMLGGIIVCMGVGMLIYIAVKKKRDDLKEIEEKALYKQETGRIRQKGSDDDMPQADMQKELFFQETERNEERKVSFQKTPQRNCGETMVLSCGVAMGPSSLVSREPGELPTIYLEKELTVIGKLENASDAVIDLPTVSRVHAKIRKRDGEFYLTDLNSRNGTSVNGRLLKAEEEYRLLNEDQVDFAQARYIFLE